MLVQPLPCRQATWRSIIGLQGAGQAWGGTAATKIILRICQFGCKPKKLPIWSQVEDLASRGGLLYRQAGNPESAAQMLVTSPYVMSWLDTSPSYVLTGDYSTCFDWWLLHTIDSSWLVTSPHFLTGDLSVCLDWWLVITSWLVTFNGG